jgi:hypothetical protein
MAEFKISEVKYRIIRKTFLSISIPVAALIICGIMLGGDKFESAGIDPTWRPIIHVSLQVFSLLFLLLSFSFVIHRTLRRIRRIISSYSIIISDSGVIRDRWYAYPITISRTEIREIIKTRNGGFLVRGLSRKDIISIPPFVNDIGRLEEELRALAPITTNTKVDRYAILRLLGYVAAVVIWIGLLSVNKNRIFEYIWAVMVLGWLLYKIRTEKNATRGEKALGWVIIFFIVVILIATIATWLMPDVISAPVH